MAENGPRRFLSRPAPVSEHGSPVRARAQQSWLRWSDLQMCWQVLNASVDDLLAHLTPERSARAVELSRILSRFLGW